MYSIVICDDIPQHADYAVQLVKAALGSESDFSISRYSKEADLIQEITEGKVRPDIAILDIEIAEDDGIELAGKIHRVFPRCKIIFLSSYAKYASAVYRREHVWFILKESAAEYMPEALQKAIQELNRKDEASVIQLHTRGNTRYVGVDEVLYLERNRHSTMVAARESRYIVATHPEELIETCRDRFIRCHQSFWVNCKAIEQMDNSIFILTDGTEIKISRTYRDSARKQFFDLKLQ